MWRIYYDDGSTFDANMGDPWEAPGHGVICVVQDDPSPPEYSVNTQILKEHPYYWFHLEWGYWMGSDRDGIIDVFTSDRKNMVCALKQGRWTRYDRYREILERARNDPDFYSKSGTSTAERKYQQ